MDSTKPTEEKEKIPYSWNNRVLTGPFVPGMTVDLVTYNIVEKSGNTYTLKPTATKVKISNEDGSQAYSICLSGTWTEPRACKNHSLDVNPQEQSSNQYNAQYGGGRKKHSKLNMNSAIRATKIDIKSSTKRRKHRNKHRGTRSDRKPKNK